MFANICDGWVLADDQGGRRVGCDAELLGGVGSSLLERDSRDSR